MARWSALALSLIFLLVALAGCLEEPPETDEDTAGETKKRSNDDRLQLEDLDGGEPEAWNATLEAAPELRLGQWWKLRLTDHFTDSSEEVTVVVAGAERDYFLTGMPKDDFSHDVMMLHMPGVGQVGNSDLSWDVHDEFFQPLKFPLRDGDTWETMWSALPVQADVVDVSGTTAEVEFTGDNQHFSLVYDAEIGAVSFMEIPDYAAMEVIDHGFGYEGVVTVPHEHDLVFFHGRLAGVLGVGAQNMEPHPPVDTISVGGDYDRVSFGIIMFALAPSLFAVDVTAPDGTQYTGELLALEPDEVYIEIFSNDEPVGDWEATFVAGAGAAFIEGIAYHVFDIDLPSGCLLGAMDEHAHHGGGDHAGGC